MPQLKKRSPALWRIAVDTTAEAEDAVSELLSSLFGVPAAAYFDTERRTSRVSVFLEHGTFSPAAAPAQLAAGLERVRSAGLDAGPATVEVARVKREDWAESWKKHFKPISVKIRKADLADAARGGSGPAQSLLVKPGWSKRRPARNQVVVRLDPGLSFGTGQHPTTGFCLREIVRCQPLGASRSFLDIGTGSGILAIAAAKLGYAPVHGFDFDPEAVRVARENAAKNRVTRRVQLQPGDVTRLPLRTGRRYDLVCANLISNLLIAERRRIVSQLQPTGTLVLAGILAAEFTEVERAFADFKLRLRSGRTENEWRSGAFCFA
jgi:ribosomal protein L11 methyltransferase